MRNWKCSGVAGESHEKFEEPLPTEPASRDLSRRLEDQTENGNGSNVDGGCLGEPYGYLGENMLTTI